MTGDLSPLLRLTQVSKVFTTDDIETHALVDVTIRIDRGEFVAIAGPSGCGKSTLLSIMGLLDVPTAGDYELNGRPTGTLSFTERAQLRNRELGFVFQSFNLVEDQTVFQNVELPLRYRRVPRADRYDRVMSALASIGMAHRAKHYPSQLSGGQQQRVAVARAVAGEPSILLADEPTGNLDSRSGDAVMTLLHALHDKGCTICVVTHDPRYTRMTTRTIHLFDGQIVGEETSSQGVGARTVVEGAA